MNKIKLAGAALIARFSPVPEGVDDVLAQFKVTHDRLHAVMQREAAAAADKEAQVEALKAQIGAHYTERVRAAQAAIKVAALLP